MYCTVDEVLSMINPDAQNHIIGEGYITDPEERRQKLAALAEPALEDACSEVDGYLAKRHTVPLPQPPRIIVKYVKDIAVYNLFSRMGMTSGDREDNYRERYRDAIKFLTLVADGRVMLGLANEQPGKQAQTGFLLKGPQRLFNRDSMRGM